MGFVHRLFQQLDPRQGLSLWFRVAIVMSLTVSLHTALFWLLMPEGRYDFFWGTIALAIGVFVPVVTTGRMIDRIYDMSQELERLAKTDPLTGVANRRSFIERMKSVLSEGPGGVLVILDIDHFKRINDTFGHEIGDRALVHISARLEDAFGKDAIVARIGGEEFAIFLPRVELRQGSGFSDRLTGPFHLDVGVSEAPVTFTASAGAVAIVPGLDLKDALRVADTALYRAKSGGRARLELDNGLSAPSPVGTDRRRIRSVTRDGLPAF